MDIGTALASYSSEVSRFALERIVHFLDKPHLNTYRSLKEISEQVSSDYRSRVIVELIQNAHDAHDADREDGKIALLLDQEEGEFGVLYVANGGKGFESKNFTALCSPAITTKRVNEGIGNKGVGFLSVFQICNFPEVYSAIGEARPLADFDGYRFRFPDKGGLCDLPQRMASISISIQC